MKLNPRPNNAFTIAELMVASGIFAAASVIIYLLLFNGSMLAAWNTAVNVAHEQARTAMLQMVQDMHSAVSLPQLISDVDPGPDGIAGTADDTHDPIAATTSPAAGVSFQLWSIGPLRVANNATKGQPVVQVTVPAGVQAPVQPATPRQSPYQRLVISSHQVEDDIVSVSPSNLGTSGGTVSLTLAHNLTTDVSGNSYHIVGFITDRCSYVVKEEPPGSGKMALKFYGPRLGKPFAVMGSSITNPSPFSTKNHETGTPYYQFVGAFDLSTAYGLGTTGRNSRSANILLRNEVPAYARLTTYQ